MNPHKATHNAGGSSGGEAALLGAGGSIIGLGSDIGGSIRMPSAFCGTCGLKPTKGRLSSKGTMSLFKGHNLGNSISLYASEQFIAKLIAFTLIYKEK